jgi:hypothetical protein
MPQNVIPTFLCQRVLFVPDHTCAEKTVSETKGAVHYRSMCGRGVCYYSQMAEVLVHSDMHLHSSRP